MKRLIVLVVAAAVLLVYGCGHSDDDDSVTGKWRGSITEKGKITLVELNLVEDKGSIEGSFTILTETGQDVEKGMVFPVVQAHRSGNALNFIVPVSEGKVDDDSIAFELVVEGETLEGFGHELRKGSGRLPVVFIRQE